jgi:hypothetical protein
MQGTPHVANVQMRPQRLSTPVRQATPTAAIIFKLSRYLNIFITRSTLNDLSTRRERTDLQQRQQKQSVRVRQLTSSLHNPHCHG